MADLTRNEKIALTICGNRGKGEENMRIRACNLRSTL